MVGANRFGILVALVGIMIVIVIVLPIVIAVVIIFALALTHSDVGQFWMVRVNHLKDSIFHNY